MNNLERMHHMANTRSQKSSNSGKPVDTTKSRSPLEKSKAKVAQDAEAVNTETLLSAHNQSPTKLASKETHMTEHSSIIQFSSDISEAEAPKPLPVGDYPARITAAEVKESARGGQYVAVTFLVSSDDYPADYTDGDPDGAILVYRRLQVEDTPRARYNMRKFVEAIGAKAGTKVDLNDWIGQTATISVAHTEYEGEERAEIKRVSA
jgi:hypothetical protein